MQVSYTALSQVCGVPSDSVHSIMKELFSRFIEENRRGREVVLDLGFGSLHAYPNSDLQFEVDAQ